MFRNVKICRKVHMYSDKEMWHVVQLRKYKRIRLPVKGRCKEREVYGPEQAVIRPFSQMAVVPDTFWQTTARCEVAMDSAAFWGSMKTASIKQPDIPETERESFDVIETRFKASVATEVQELEKIKKDRTANNVGIIQYCMTVAQTYKKLSRQIQSQLIGNSVGRINNQEFLISTMAPIYDAALNDALKVLQQDMAENRNTRELFKKVNRAAIPVKALLANSTGYQGYIKTLYDFFRHCINNELLYLEYLSLKKSPSQYAVRASVTVIDWILSPGAIAGCLSLISYEERKEIDGKKNELLQHLDSRMKSCIAEEEKEKT